MGSRIKESRKKVFFRFLLSYMLVLLIPISIASLAYREAVKIVDKNAIRHNLSVLEQSKDIVNQRLAEVNNMVTQIGFNPKVSSLMNMGQMSEGSPYIFYLWDLYKDIAPYLITNNFIFDFFIYPVNSNIIISPKYVHTRLSFFYGEFFKYEGMELPEWKTEISGKYHNKEYLPARKVLMNGKKYSIVTYMQSIPLEYPLEKKGVIMVLINEEEIQKLLKPINISNGGWAYIADRGGNIISSVSMNKNQIKYIQLDSTEKSGFMHKRIDGQDMIVSFTSSKDNGWTYVTAIPSRVVMSEVDYVKNIIYTIVVLSLLVGILTAYYLAYRNTRPIRNLVNTLKDIIGGEQEKTVNEFDFLQGTVSQLVSNNKRIQQAMNEQAALIKMTFFDRLLKGEFHHQSQIEIMLSHMDLALTGCQYVVIVVKINEYNNEVSKENLQKLDMIRIIVRDILLRYVEQKGNLHDIDENKMALLLSEDTGDREAFETYIDTIMTESQRDLLLSCNIKISFAVGGIYENLIDINRSYNEAKQALEYYVIKDGKDVVWFKNISISGDGYYYPIYVETRIISLVKAGNAEEVEKLLHSVYMENFINRQLSFEIVQQLIYEMRGTIIKLLEQINIAFSAGSVVTSVESMEEAVKVYGKILNSYRSICSMINKQRNDHTETLKEEVLGFVHSSYMDNSLCLGDLAEKFNYTESQLYQLFKSITGLTFSDYLENIRIQKSCELLDHTGFSVKEIADKVGYNNDTTFRRAFKRNQGIGPTEYRMLKPQKT